MSAVLALPAIAVAKDIYVLEIPEGVSGKLHGNFRGRPQQPPAEERPADERRPRSKSANDGLGRGGGRR